MLLKDVVEKAHANRTSLPTALLISERSNRLAESTYNAKNGDV